MTITTNTTDRKALAKAIAEELGTTARYLGLLSGPAFLWLPDRRLHR